MYVVDSLLYFVKNTDELAGTLCHEVSHTIHHDTMTLMEKQQKIAEREVGAAILLGPTRAQCAGHPSSWQAAFPRATPEMWNREPTSPAPTVCCRPDTTRGDWYGYSRILKTPERTEIPQILSDHPNDQNRVDALERHFRKESGGLQKVQSGPKVG